jgi:hypothetical protein
MKQEMGMQGIRRRKSRAAGSFFAAALALAIWAQGATAVPPQVSKTSASAVSSTTAVLEASINPQGVKTAFHFEYGTSDCAKSACPNVVPVPNGEAGSGTSAVRVKAPIEGLTLATVYHFVVVAKNQLGETVKGPDRVFVTLGVPFKGLPDERAYEQASPVNKNGGDAVGKLELVKAASTGGGITFGSTFGIPGGKGAQALPTYLATRGSGESGWSTEGLLPPANSAEIAQILGWLPDFSMRFSSATQLGEPRTTALLAQTAGGPPTLIAPYVNKPTYSFAGASTDAASVIFESQAQLPPTAGKEPIPNSLKGASNVYAWDKTSGELHLASVSNNGASPAKGAFAGPYNWLAGISATTLGQGGAARRYYLQDEHAVSSSGDVVFTEAGTGQLYLRKNPTRPQSELEGEECTKAAEACTLHVSASQRSTPDPAGPQPAAFQVASADGSKVFFTSPEKLTDDANTGPVPASAAIGIGGIGGGIEDADFVKQHAVGVAVDSEYVYWADPGLESIGRAKLNGEDVESTFIPIPPGECETEANPEEEPGVFEKVTVPSTPRYVAVDSKYIYWTNTGRRDKDGNPLDGGGTIGRAEIDGEEGSVDPDFICGEVKTEPGKKRRVNNPQGIAVDAGHIYWANAATGQATIARAAIDGTAVERNFFQVTGASTPHGVALSPSHVYFSAVANVGSNSEIIRFPLEGGAEDKFLFIGKSVPRGLAIDAAHVYWAAQAGHTIGRADLELENSEKEFTKEIDGDMNGLAVDSAHVYWSVNGEAPINPGNDLYLYEPATETLEDLTALEGGDGAEVQGVLGASENGSRVYFAANGVLDGAEKALPGDCHTAKPHDAMSSLTGNCNLYLWQEGVGTSLVARLRGSDAVNWAATPLAVFEGQKTSFTTPDGGTLLFRSREQLTAYENEGSPELYRFAIGDAEIRCVSCLPGGEAPLVGPSLGSIRFPQIAPLEGAALASRNLSADGSKAFFETTEALVPADTNGAVGCSLVGLTPACLDVYEWEAPGSGECEESGPAFNLLNGGCLYLISTGKSESPSFFADASRSGDDVFFFTRDQLVGQDQDELQDVYDAPAGGGLGPQNPVFKVPCESNESCHGPIQTPPAEQSAGTEAFVGPRNPVSKPKTHKAKKKAKHKKHAKKRASTKRGAAR